MGMRLPTAGPIATGTSKPRPKTVHFLRHGITEMNEYLSRHQYGSRGFKDPLLYDTRLTPDGHWGAMRAAKLTKALSPQPEVLLVSPLTRALQTAAHAFEHYDGPIEVEALARERVYLSSDCGRSPDELRKEFPDSRLSFDHLPEKWWHDQAHPDPKAIHQEPDDVFFPRVERLRQLLLSRPEQSIAVVAHWGLLNALTGHDYENCELRSYELIESGFTCVNNPLL